MPRRVHVTPGSPTVPPSAPDCSCGGAAPHTAASVSTLPFVETFPAPEYPPVEWFTPPADIEPGRRLHVDEDGRVYGYFYLHGVGHVDGTASIVPGRHEGWMPGPSPTGYTRFHQADVVTADGELRQRFAGPIGNVGGHASPFISPAAASRHYADPDAQLMVVRAGEDEIGGWVAGSLLPGKSYGDVAMLRRSSLSGDWRWLRGDRLQAEDGYDCIGPTLVTRPGLATFHPFARAASAGPPECILGGCGGVDLPEEGRPYMKVTTPDGTIIEVDDAPETGTHVATAPVIETTPPPPAADPSTPVEATVALDVGDLVSQLDTVITDRIDAALVRHDVQRQAAQIEPVELPV